MSFIKRILIITLISLILIEVSVRVLFAFRIGPDILFYGTRFNYGFGEEREWKELIKNKQSVAEHPAIVNNYSKYFPNQKRFDFNPCTGEVFDVVINRNGFRGKDYELAKDKNVLRIATLGGSSTFGYGNRDNETYPYYLEEIICSRIMDDSKFINYKNGEVINFGIPHQTSEQILSLLINEVLPCQPDIITFYEGINDTTQNVGLPLGKIEISKTTSFGIVMKYFKARVLALAWVWEIMKVNKRYSRDYYLNQLAEKRKFFIDNILKIRRICLNNNIIFIVITQQAKSCSFDVHNLTYSEEVKLLETKVLKNKLTYNELCFLIHSSLMAELKKLAVKNKIYIIDGIGVLDDDRSCLTSWVHLTPEGNKKLATAIADKICTIK
jgi:hypothetical protein